jgi:hypothetical protein
VLVTILRDLRVNAVNLTEGIFHIFQIVNINVTKRSVGKGSVKVVKMNYFKLKYQRRKL